MSLRLEILQVARLAPKLLGEAAPLVARFLHGQQNPDGGFKDRDSRSDLYYTAFALDALSALQQAPSGGIQHYLDQFQNLELLDLIHLCCLARCLAATDHPSNPSGLIREIEKYRSRDGGYALQPEVENGTAYASFLALGAYEDLKHLPPDPMRMVQSLKFLETPDGGWGNERGMTIGSTNATAAAITVLRNLNLPVNRASGDWLLQQVHSQGGFKASPSTPLPDLLSTATALHALAALEVSFELQKEKGLDFIDSLWTNEGSFYGHWHDETLDCEYTFYGLLALGHLSL